MKNYVGSGYISHVKICFPTVEDMKICQIKVSKSSKPVFTKLEGMEDCFVRSGCSSQPLGREEQSAYERSHWSSK